MRSLGRPFGRLLVSAVALALIDLVVGRIRSTESIPAALEFVGLRRVLVLSLLGATGLYAGAFVLRLRSGAAALGVFGFLLGTYVDVVFFNWERMLVSKRVLIECLPAGVGLGLILFLVAEKRLAREKGSEGDTRSTVLERVLFSGATLLALAILCAPGWIEEEDASRELTPRSVAVSAGHRIPRVLLIVVDTLRADALSASSEAPSSTPTLDAFAKQSHRFLNARSPSGWTLPAMVSLLTGVSPWVHGATGRRSRVPDALPTLAEAMRDGGYRTGAIGQNAVLGKLRRLDRGFDSYHFPTPTLPPTRSLGVLLVALARANREPDSLDARQINDLAFDWFERHGQEDFFLWLHYYDSHMSYGPPPEFQPDGQPPAGLGRTYDFHSFKEQRAGYEVLDSEQREWVRDLYRGEVSYFDRALFELFARMQELGIYEDTLILFTSDHGEEFWEHEGFEHGHTLYEELVRVPLMVRIPGQTEGALVSSPVSLENIAPTILSLCGVEHDPDHLSASSLFENDGRLAATPSAPFVSVGNLYYQDRSSVLFGDFRYKYIRIEESGIEELYDLESDPDERASLAISHPELLAQGSARFEERRLAAQSLREKLGIREDAETSLTSDQQAQLSKLGYASDEAQAEE